MTDSSVQGDPKFQDPWRSWLSQAGVLMIAIVLFRIGFELWWVGRIHEHLWTQVGVSLFYLVGTVFLVAAGAAINHERLDRIGFLVLCAAVGFYFVTSMKVFAIHYTSDALLFVHQASLLTLNDLNPYQHTLVGGYEAFQVPYYVQTPTTSGGLITNFNYPALSFLIYTPFVALGLDDLRPISAAFLIATLGLLYLAVPRYVRLLTLGFLFLSSFFLSFALSGFDILYVFFLLISVILWRHNHTAAMLAFGIAAAIKQPVWFIAPFLLIRLWKASPEHHRRGRLWHTAKNTSYAIAAFLIPNAWFIIWDPLTWLQAVLTPLGGTGDVLVPLSQGLTIVFYTGTFHAAPFLLTSLSMSLFLCLVAFYWVKYEKFREVVWLTPALILLVNERALQNYYEMFYPIVLALIVSHMPYTWADVHERDGPEPTEGAPAAAQPRTEPVAGA